MKKATLRTAGLALAALVLLSPALRAQSAGTLKSITTRKDGAQLQVLGPAPSPIPRLRGRYREQLLVKGDLGEARKCELQSLVVEIGRAAPGVEFQVDVDPVNML